MPSQNILHHIVILWTQPIVKVPSVVKKVCLAALLFCTLFIVWTTYNKQEYVRISVTNKLCNVSFVDQRLNVANDTKLPMIYYVTPTYPRPEQVPELTRLSHTLMHVSRIHWIVADDQPVCSGRVLNVLLKSGLPFTHISSPKPFIYNVELYSRGVANRRAALTWINGNVKAGILYFGDDDNTVDLQLFNEIRATKKVSMFPVGLIDSYGVSSPVIKDGKVVGFFDSWPEHRKFAVDMAGFAVNIKFLSSSASMPYVVGHEEDRFLVSLGLEYKDIEPLADNCSKVLVWHTKTYRHKRPTLRLDLEKLKGRYASFAHLLEETSDLGMANFDPIDGKDIKITLNRKDALAALGLP